MEETPQWVEQMFEELNRLSDVDQVVTAGTWITLITSELLADLAQRRRVKVVEILARPGWDPTRLAETIGSRPTAIRRLRDEGNRLLGGAAGVQEYLTKEDRG